LEVVPEEIEYLPLVITIPNPVIELINNAVPGRAQILDLKVKNN